MDEPKKRILCNGPSMPTLSLTEKDDEGVPAMLPGALSAPTYTRDKVNYLRHNIHAGALKQIHASAVDDTRACLLYIETALALSPHYLLSAMWFNSHNSGPGTIYFMAAHENSECPGVPFMSYTPQTSNAGTAFNVGLRSTIFNNLHKVKLITDTLITRHMSPHDIYHMLNTLSLNGAFAISRLGETMARISAETKHTGYTTLFAVLSAIYENGISNTTATRIPRKISEIKNAVSQYLQDTKNAKVRIMSKENPLPENFYL